MFTNKRLKIRVEELERELYNFKFKVRKDNNKLKLYEYKKLIGKNVNINQKGIYNSFLDLNNVEIHSIELEGYDFIIAYSQNSCKVELTIIADYALDNITINK